MHFGTISQQSEANEKGNNTGEESSFWSVGRKSAQLSLPSPVPSFFPYPHPMQCPPLLLKSDFCSFFCLENGIKQNTSLISSSQLAKLLGKMFPGVKKDKQISKHKEWINWGFNSIVLHKVKDVSFCQAFHCNVPPIKLPRTSSVHSTSWFSEDTGACHRCLKDLLTPHLVKNMKKKLPGRITSSS